MLTWVLTSYHSRRPSFQIEEACTGIECTLLANLDALIFLLWIGGFALVTLATLLYLPRARSAVTEERSRTAAERDAFERFRKHLSKMDLPTSPSGSKGDTAPPTAGMGQSTAGMASSTGGSTGHGLLYAPQKGEEAWLREVRDAYRDTVMAVPHYEEEYDEPIAVNMAAEFDTDVATAVCNGDQITPQVASVLNQYSTDAVERRVELLKALARESESIDEAYETFGEADRSLQHIEGRSFLQRPYQELLDIWDRLGDLEDRCERQLEARQEAIAAQPTAWRTDDTPSLQAYLYADLPVTHPLLAEGAQLIERIRELQKNVLFETTERI